jgi:hypothetical protein
VSRRPEGGRERERKGEPAGNPRIPAGSVSDPDRDPVGRGYRSDPAGYLTFRFRSDLSNVTDSGRVQISSSRSHRPSQSPTGETRRRTRGRGRGRDEVRQKNKGSGSFRRDLGLSFKRKKKKINKSKKKTEEKKEVQRRF